MFISSEHWDEEVFPLGYFVVFSLNKDFEEYEKSRPLKSKNADFSGIERKASSGNSNGRLKQNKYKSIEKTVRHICRRSGYHLRAIKIADGQILMVISSQSGSKTKFNSAKSEIDLQSFSSTILSNAEALKKLEKFYCLWRNQQADAAIECVKNGKKNLEFDLPL